MSDIDTLNIITINCNTIDTQRNDSTNNYPTNTTICQSSKHVQQYTNMIQDVDRAEKSYANLDTISKFENKGKTIIIDEEPKTRSYFLPGSNHNNDKRVSAKITQQLQREFKVLFNEIGCFDRNFHCR